MPRGEASGYYKIHLLLCSNLVSENIKCWSVLVAFSFVTDAVLAVKPLFAIITLHVTEDLVIVAELGLLFLAAVFMSSNSKCSVIDSRWFSNPSTSRMSRTQASPNHLNRWSKCISMMRFDRGEEGVNRGIYIALIKKALPLTYLGT